MIDPAIIKKIAGMVLAIHEQVQKMKALNPLAASLEKRVNILKDTLDKLQGVKDTKSLDSVIARIVNLLENDCTRFITDLANMSNIKKFIRAGSLVTEHGKIEAELDRAIADVLLALNTYSALTQEAAAERQIQELRQLTEAQERLRLFQETEEKYREEWKGQLQEELIGLQQSAAEILEQGDHAAAQLQAAQVSLADIKAKLDALHVQALKQDPRLPRTIKLTVLAKGATADEVVHETVIGVGMGAISIPEGADERTITMAERLASFALKATMAAQADPRTQANVDITVIEAGAYAKLVTERTSQAQPGKLEVTQRIAPGSAAQVGQAFSARTGGGGSHNAVADETASAQGNTPAPKK